MIWYPVTASLDRLVPKIQDGRKCQAHGRDGVICTVAVVSGGPIGYERTVQRFTKGGRR
jgi:hypothetical protein